MTTSTARLFRRGKVRDTYDLGDQLLMVASDRVSAFDVVLPSTIPGKGVVLTQLSAFWFARTRDIVPNHLVATDIADLPTGLLPTGDLRGRSMLVRRADRIDVECVVRGYLAGSGWQEYRQRGTLASAALPPGLRQSDRLPEPRFTPAAKNDAGHDENISVATLRSTVGREVADRLEATSLALYRHASEAAAFAGLILADTKFEFGFVDGELTLIDEALTPDSSRFWDAAAYAPGGDPPSFDKQYVRDWLARSGWDKEPPGPELPQYVIDGTLTRYREAYRRLTGRELALP